MHGTTMIFLVVVPMLAGFANYLVPLMIGARDMAFPRLNALSYWLFPLGGLLLYFSFLAKGGAGRGRLDSYAPLATLHSPGRGQDYWILVAARADAVVGRRARSTSSSRSTNMRAPGMTWPRMPLFVWTILTSPGCSSSRCRRSRPG